jgi:Flp pilus assembly protein TadD
MRTLVEALALAVVLVQSLPAQMARPPATMARADSAWNRGDRALAGTLYAAILTADSTASRAVFRLAQLESSPERALALYRRYIVLEPSDAWGHMAEGDLLARMERFEEALIAYDGAHAIAPGERDVAVGRARLLDRAGRSYQAADELTAWTLQHPDDGEAWDLLGRAHVRAGRPRAASEAFWRADGLAVPGARSRRDMARAAAAPSITPEVASLGDSDGNRTTRLGAVVDVMTADGVRLGAGAALATVGSDIDEVRGTDFDLRFATTPSPLVRISAVVGATTYGNIPVAATAAPNAPNTPNGPNAPNAPDPGRPSGPAVGRDAWRALRASARIRVRAPGSGPTLDLRLERSPLGFNSLLIQNRVERLEVRTTVELPVKPFRLRGVGRFGHLAAAAEPANGRSSVEGALVLPLGTIQPSVQYRRAGFQRASAAGYFAPRLAETVDVGVYAETGDDAPLALSADIGAGAQRVTPHGGSAGAWSRVWRAWSQAALALGPSRSWFVELEAYDAPFALEGAGAAGSWRFLSVSSGLRWAIR